LTNKYEKQKETSQKNSDLRNKAFDEKIVCSVYNANNNLV